MRIILKKAKAEEKKDCDSMARTMEYLGFAHAIAKTIKHKNLFETVRKKIYKDIPKVVIDILNQLVHLTRLLVIFMRATHFRKTYVAKKPLINVLSQPIQFDRNSIIEIYGAINTAPLASCSRPSTQRRQAKLHLARLVECQKNSELTSVFKKLQRLTSSEISQYKENMFFSPSAKKNLERF